MQNTEEFRAEQRRVVAGMVSGLAITALALMLAAAWEPVGMPVRPLTERLQVALRTDLFVIGWLAAAIANVARLRFFSPDDIAGGKVGLGSKSIQDATAILQNTFEQCVLAISTHLAFATVSGHPTSILITLAILFCAGRAMFWIGYRRGANGRALGFALTFYPTIAMLGMSAVTIALGTTQ
ncbi:MAPEG family protein [Methylobacterium sp. J-076]|uniref:MAPEG family protein n=1 Tax=Methylobacterium sp. J-076 TaxID=2836655 RepID=UPI001FBA7297|nr:MAPEG family protein [Methylobacterium sp. J-076]MCJ2011772.1 MAPEG family protein [Methylobacterium sp. J-076]